MAYPAAHEPCRRARDTPGRRVRGQPSAASWRIGQLGIVFERAGFDEPGQLHRICSYGGIGPPDLNQHDDQPARRGDEPPEGRDGDEADEAQDRFELTQLGKLA
jgi:hypothetical protein